MVLTLLGRCILCEAVLLLLPAGIALFHGESILGFLVAIGISLLLGGIGIIKKPASRSIYAKEGFVACALSWIVLSLIGAVPFVIEKWIPNYIDAVFEIVSGFTTTGATILSDFSMDGCYGLFFWRALSHFIGGMGVLVFILAIMPLSNERSIYLMRAEVPGPTVNKLVPKLKNTAIILYLIYILLTVSEVVMLLLGGMSLYEAVIHAFATAGTGGFSNRAGSIAEFSPYIQYVISVFMLIFATNFNIHYLILMRQFKSAFKDEEFHWYWAIVAVFTAAIAINIGSMMGNAESAFRTALFQVSSIISSTGFLTIDLSLLPAFSQVMLIMLMFIGACAGSTGGAIKVSRIVILVKAFLNELRHLLHPGEVLKVRINSKPLPEGVVRSTLLFFGMYMFLISFSMIIVSLDGYDFTTTSSAVISCMGNMGPGLWKGSSFAGFSYLSKIVLSLDMLLGRLEIIPILMLFNPSVWKHPHR